MPSNLSFMPKSWAKLQACAHGHMTS